MEFGLWFEPEMINIDSDVARAHPEWVMATGDRLPVESRFQQVINLGMPGLLRLHPGRDLRDPARVRHRLHQVGPQPRSGRRRHPAGRPTGRARADAGLLPAAGRDQGRASRGWRSSRAPPAAPGSISGVLERTDRVWVSDCIDPLERQEMHRWTTQLIPPELMGAHIASGRVPHHRSHPRPRLPGRHGDLRSPGHRVGPVQGVGHRAGRARRLDRLLQGAPRPAARGRPGPDRLPRRQPERPRGGVAGQEQRDLLAGLGGPVRAGLHRAGCRCPGSTPTGTTGSCRWRTCSPGPVGCRAGGD